jgi:hypothetical protein
MRQIDRQIDRQRSTGKDPHPPSLLIYKQSGMKA